MQDRNNTVFEKKHYYLNILKNTEELRLALEKEREELDDEVAVEKQLRSVYRMKTMAFAGLIKEGIQCYTIKDLESNDTVTFKVGMIIDGKEYSCRKSVLNKMLREEYSENDIDRYNEAFKPGKNRELLDDGKSAGQKENTAVNKEKNSDIMLKQEYKEVQQKRNSVTIWTKKSQKRNPFIQNLK